MDPPVAIVGLVAPHPPCSASFEELVKHVLDDPLGQIAKWKALPKPSNAAENSASCIFYQLSTPLQSDLTRYAAALPPAAQSYTSDRVEDFVQITMVTRSGTTSSGHHQIDSLRLLSEMQHAHPTHPMCNFVVESLLALFAHKPADLLENGIRFQPSCICFSDVFLARLVDLFAREAGLNLAVGYVQQNGTDGCSTLLFCCANAECSRIGTHKMRCSSCKVAWYCSKECQVVDWKAYHKRECKRIKVAGNRRGKAESA